MHLDLVISCLLLKHPECMAMDKKIEHCKTMSTTRVRSFQMQARISGAGILVAQNNDQSVMRDLQWQNISKVAT